MGLIRDIKDGVYVGTSIVIIVLTILEAVSIIVAVLITLNAMNNHDVAGGISALLYWLVAWLLQQLYVWPITLIVDQLNKWSVRR
jgi:hypothetical protein